MKNEPTMNTVTETALGYFMEHKGMYSQADVEKLLATARAEGERDGISKFATYVNDSMLIRNRVIAKDGDTVHRGSMSILKIKDNYLALTTKEHHAS